METAGMVLGNFGTPGLGENKDSQESNSQTNLAVKVYDFVVKCVCEGKFAPARKITQREVAKELEMSPIPVREGFEILQQQGWVERIPNKGVRIRSFTREDLNKLYELRETIEAGAVRLVCNKINPQQVEQLREIVKTLETACNKRDVKAYQHSDIEFHRLLVYFTGNERMENFFESILLQSRLFISIGAYKTAFQWKDSLEMLELVSHKHVLEAIADRDAELAEEMIRKHIQMGLELAKMGLKYVELGVPKQRKIVMLKSIKKHVQEQSLALS